MWFPWASGQGSVPHSGGGGVGWGGNLFRVLLCLGFPLPRSAFYSIDLLAREAWYLATIDIMFDRGGFYLFWYGTGNTKWAPQGSVVGWIRFWCVLCFPTFRRC